MSSAGSSPPSLLPGGFSTSGFISRVSHAALVIWMPLNSAHSPVHWLIHSFIRSPMHCTVIGASIQRGTKETMEGLSTAGGETDVIHSRTIHGRSWVILGKMELGRG